MRRRDILGIRQSLLKFEPVVTKRVTISASQAITSLATLPPNNIPSASACWSDVQSSAMVNASAVEELRVQLGLPSLVELEERAATAKAVCESKCQPVKGARIAAVAGE